MKKFKPGDKVIVQRDIYRWDGPLTEQPLMLWVSRDGVSVLEQFGTQMRRTRILYAKAGDEGAVLEAFRSGSRAWSVKVLIDGKCRTFKQTTLALLSRK